MAVITWVDHPLASILINENEYVLLVYRACTTLLLIVICGFAIIKESYYFLYFYHNWCMLALINSFLGLSILSLIKTFPDYAFELFERWLHEFVVNDKNSEEFYKNLDYMDDK